MEAMFPVPKQSEPPKIPKSWKVEDAYKEPYNVWQHDPTPVNLQGLLGSLDRDIVKAVKRVNQGKASPALKTQAKIMLANKLPNYEPSRASLRTWTSSQLQALQRAAAQQSMPVRIPERQILDVQRMNRDLAQFEEEEGREPSIVELADRLKLSRGRIKKLMALRSPMNTGWFDAMGAEDSDGGGFSPAVLNTVNDKLLLEHLYETAAPMDQIILEYTFGLNGRHPQSTKFIAQKIRRSPGLVSQRRKALQESMQRMQGFMRK